MGILGIVFLLLVLIGFGIFIYLMVKTAHGWGALQTTLLYFLFFSTLVFMFCAAGVAKRRVGWVRVHDKTRNSLEEMTKEETKIKYGDLTSTAQDNDALVPALSHLARLTSSRGRVWKNAMLQNFDAQKDEYLLRLAGPNPAGQPADAAAAPPPAAGAAPAAAPNGTKLIDEELVVYAFAEIRDATGRMVPAAYLGEFIVDKSSGSEAKLKPTAALLPIQKDFIVKGNAATWTIFELMPVDSHEVFAAEGSQSSDDAYFGRMDDQQIKTLFAAMAEQNPKMAEVMQSYLIDGSEAPANTQAPFLWVLVEFVKEHTITVDAGGDGRVATEGGFFDPTTGLTVDARLKRGEEFANVKYAPGDKRLVWSGAADKLISQGLAKAIKRIYVRPLNNYANGFRDLRQGILSTLQQIELVKRENSIVVKTNQVGQEQLLFRQDERQKLDKDLAQVQKEDAVAASEVKRLEEQLASVQKKIASTLQQLQSAHGQLVSGGSR